VNVTVRSCYGSGLSGEGKREEEWEEEETAMKQNLFNSGIFLVSKRPTEGERPEPMGGEHFFE